MQNGRINDPREPHFILYLKVTLHHGLTLHRSTSHSLVAYSGADWARYPDTRRSTSGFCMYLGDNLISWSSRCQTTVSRSSAEAEYRAISTAVAESCWVRQLMQELHRPIKTATIV
jgi:hypothetical protein